MSIFQFAVPVSHYQTVSSHSYPIQPPFSYGFPMLFLWFSYDFPLVFPHSQPDIDLHPGAKLVEIRAWANIFDLCPVFTSKRPQRRPPPDDSLAEAAAAANLRRHGARPGESPGILRNLRGLTLWLLSK